MKIVHLLRRMLNTFLLTMAVILAACAQKPTKTYTTQDIDTLFMQKKLQRPIRVNTNTVLVDARSDFAFAMLHAPQAVHLKWTDFTKDSSSGELKADLSRTITRLALFGISPKSSVIVLSGGQNSWPVAGRVAWTLQYLGIPDVQMVDQNALGLRYYNMMAPPRSNVATWEPKFNDRVTVKSNEVMRWLAGRLPPQTRLLFVGKNRGPNRPGILHLEWSRFFNKYGRPNVEMIKFLGAKRLSLTDRIVVVSERGISSGAVAFALSAMGFRDVANCAAGLPLTLARTR